MEKKLLKILPYDEVDFRFISNHYDVHLNGTCMLDGKICEFENEYPEYDDEKDDFKEMFVKIYKLDFINKLKWRWQQWKFEKCIGYHWTYPYRKNGERPFRYRNPKWFYVWLFNRYYGR
jgi:hypothetical protein